ncbi:uncharacterized protein LOC105189365 [Harpegnathos saltator]|uniref:uncharacterized protein LOC105189365 n=1 Tax=Harpegnathos saltator TaxID=610380 RepID=UPI00058F7DAC|nr:uncharacterized protein LOC105189365 [Harpegnathos saltator]
MKTIIVLFGVVTFSCCSKWDFGNHDGLGNGLTLGEISLDHHDLGAFSLGKTDGHSLDLLEDHQIISNKASGWHTDTSSFHGGHVIPVYKNIGIPTIKKVPVSIPHPVVQTVAQPYPVPVVISKPVPYEVEKQVITTVEKKVPTPVEKIIPVPIEKLVPFPVVKHVPVPVAKPIPIKIPVYKTIVHKVKGHG